jgi:hypothetical protein
MRNLAMALEHFDPRRNWRNGTPASLDRIVAYRNLAKIPACRGIRKEKQIQNGTASESLPCASHESSRALGRRRSAGSIPRPEWTTQRFAVDGWLASEFRDLSRAVRDGKWDLGEGRYPGAV